MPRSLARTSAFARFEALRMLRARLTTAGIVLFLATHAIGRWQDAGGDALFGVAYLVALALSFNPGLSSDRESDFDRLMTFDFVSPAEYALGKSAGMVAWIVLLGSACWLIATAFGKGDVGFATWFTSLMTLVALASLPFIAALDMLMRTRLPAAAFLIVAIVTVLAATALGMEAETVQRALGIGVTRYDYPSLLPLAIRAGAGLALTPALIVVGLRLARRA